MMVNAMLAGLWPREREEVPKMRTIVDDPATLFGVLQKLGAEQDVAEMRHRQRASAGQGKVLSPATTTLPGSMKSAGHRGPTATIRGSPGIATTAGMQDTRAYTLHKATPMVGPPAQQRRPGRRPRDKGSRSVGNN